MMLLCDYAEEVNGKLYIAGGGWSRLGANQPQLMALAIRMLIPWDQANRPHNVVIELMTEDGDPATDENAGMTFKVEGKIEVGRPPGLRPGTALDSALAFRLPAQFLPGAYRFELTVDGSQVASCSFEAIGE